MHETSESANKGRVKNLPLSYFFLPEMRLRNRLDPKMKF